jgi:hypothetical protein
MKTSRTSKPPLPSVIRDSTQFEGDLRQNRLMHRGTEAVAYTPKKALIHVKGLSEVKVDKICEAA